MLIIWALEKMLIEAVLFDLFDTLILIGDMRFTISLV